MKKFKKFALVLSAVCLAAALGACNNVNDNVPGNTTDNTQNQTQQGEQGEDGVVENPELPAVKIKYDSVSDSITLKSSGEVLFLSEVGKLKITTAENGTSDTTKKISSTMQNAFDYNKSQAENMKNDFVAFLEESEEAVTQSWAFESTYKNPRNDAYAVSITEEIYMSAGGAHPNTANFGYNFDSQTGELLTFEALFGEKEADNDKPFVKLDNLIRAKIGEAYGEELKHAAEEYLSVTGVEDTTAFVNKAYDSWYFNGNDGITIHYSTYKIAPYAAGAFEINISAQELREISANVEKYLK